jgi:hypothetical protein
MKIKFLKAHGGYVKGDQIECGKTRAERFFEAGIAEDPNAAKEQKAPKVTKERKAKIQTK